MHLRRQHMAASVAQVQCRPIFSLMRPKSSVHPENLRINPENYKKTLSGDCNTPDVLCGTTVNPKGT